MSKFCFLSFFIATFSFNGHSQSYVDYKEDSRLFIALNSGVTWTAKTEIDSRLRAGYGLVLGYTLNMQSENFLSYDIQARFSQAWFGGQSKDYYQLDYYLEGLDNYRNVLNNYVSQTGYFIPNHKTKLLRGSLGLAINTNRLRERTGLNFYLLGTIGLAGYHTSADLLQDELYWSGKIYDYNASAYTSNQTSSNYIKQRDRSYETDLAGTADEFVKSWMPSVGLGFSYQFAWYFSLGLEYEQTWTRNNDFDGMTNDIDGMASSKNDKFHYFSATLKFHIPGGSIFPKKESMKVNENATKD